MVSLRRSATHFAHSGRHTLSTHHLLSLHSFRGYRWFYSLPPSCDQHRRTSCQPHIPALPCSPRRSPQASRLSYGSGRQPRRVEWRFLPLSPSGSPIAIGGFIEPPPPPFSVALPRCVPYFHDPSRVLLGQLHLEGGSIVHPPLVGRRITLMTFRVTCLPRHPPSTSSTFHPIDLPSHRPSTVFQLLPAPLPILLWPF